MSSQPTHDLNNVPWSISWDKIRSAPGKVILFFGGALLWGIFNFFVAGYLLSDPPPAPSLDLAREVAELGGRVKEQTVMLGYLQREMRQSVVANETNTAGANARFSTLDIELRAMQKEIESLSTADQKNGSRDAALSDLRTRLNDLGKSLAELSIQWTKSEEKKLNEP